jgi:hypothetical protein
MRQIRANYSPRLHSGVCAVAHQRTPQSRLLSAKKATKEKGSERTLGIGGAEFLEHLGDAHKRRLTNAAAGVHPLPPHPSVLPDGLVRCGAHSLALAAVASLTLRCGVAPKENLERHGGDALRWSGRRRKFGWTGTVDMLVIVVGQWNHVEMGHGADSRIPGSLQGPRSQLGASDVEKLRDRMRPMH